MDRKYSIDLLRVISAIAVIIIHIVSAPVTNSAVEIDGALLSGLELIHSFMKWSVPVFFMITGYCLISKKECSYKYCFRHVWKYIGVLFTVGLFYALLEEVFVAKTISLSILANSVLNVISGNLWDHMWFVYTTIGIYLVMPVIHNFLHTDSPNAFILTVLLFIFNILLPTFENWITVGIDFPFHGYLFYVCMGGLFAQQNISKKTLRLISLTGLLSALWIVVFKVYGADYKHLAICFMAIGIFSIVSKMNIPPNRLLLSISQCTWGIYLIHPFFINIAVKLLRIDFITSYAYVKLLVFAILVFLCSFACTYLLRNIPYIKKLF